MKEGFTLAELVVYVGLLSLISVFLIQLVLNLSTSYQRLQGARDVVASARVAMEAIARETEQAKSMYTPTSILGAATSQLSLETTLNPQVSETHTYVDFYVDNKRLYEKREGGTVLPLTSDSVTVDQFLVNRFLTGTRESAQVTLVISSRLGGIRRASTTLSSSFTPRGNY